MTPSDDVPEFARLSLERLGSPAFEWYRHDEDLPSERDEEAARAVEGYLAASPAEREAAARAVDPWSGHSLVSFAERACGWALRTAELRRLHQAAAAVAWQWLGCEDPCDGIAVLGALADASVRLGHGAASVFAFGRANAPAAVATAFDDFLLRPDLDDIAAVMGYKVVPTPAGLTYLRVW